MADFRKMFLALIAGALLFTAVASAQPYSCNANAVPTLGRSEGIAENVGEVLLVCLGSIPSGGILANIRYRLTQNITSDLESGSTTEALLILVEGADGFKGYNGWLPGQQNVYQAVRISNDEIEWTGVWLAGSGSPAFKTIRLTNIRGNAQAAGEFGTLFATVNIVSPTSVPVVLVPPLPSELGEVTSWAVRPSPLSTRCGTLRVTPEGISLKRAISRVP
jgi:hypothetical protein